MRERSGILELIQFECLTNTADTKYRREAVSKEQTQCELHILFQICNVIGIVLN